MSYSNSDYHGHTHERWAEENAQEASGAADAATPASDTPTPPEPLRSRCRTCDAEIIWALTSKRKLMPVDAEPLEGGNLAITVNRKGVVLSYVLGPLDEPTDGKRYVSHFATCRQANDWRKA